MSNKRSFNLPQNGYFTGVSDLIRTLRQNSAKIAEYCNVSKATMDGLIDRLTEEAGVATEALDMYPYCFVRFGDLTLPLYYDSRYIGSYKLEVGNLVYLLMIACKIIQNTKQGFIMRGEDVTTTWLESNIVFNFYYTLNGPSYVVLGLRLNIEELAKEGIELTQQTLRIFEHLYAEGLEALPLTL